MNKNTIPHHPFYFIRHGETDWNRRGIYMGSTDIPLNQTGIDQADKSIAWLRQEPIAHIATSPLSRATKTAEIIAAKIQKPITVIDDLKECVWGIKEGQPVGLDGLDLIEQWLAGKPFEGAETADEFGFRVMRGFKTALTLTGPVLIVAHGGVYCAIQRIFGWPFINLKNCAPLLHCPPEHSTHPWQICDLSEGR